MQWRSLEPAFGRNRLRAFSGWSVQPKGPVHWHWSILIRCMHALTRSDTSSLFTVRTTTTAATTITTTTATTTCVQSACGWGRHQRGRWKNENLPVFPFGAGGWLPCLILRQGVRCLWPDEGHLRCGRLGILPHHLGCPCSALLGPTLDTCFFQSMEASVLGSCD